LNRAAAGGYHEPMGEDDRVRIEVHLDPSGSRETISREIREGLAGAPKSLPSKYFYDERGSGLFERITELPEYYLTRAERALLELRADEIAELTRPGELVELGSGSAKKTRLLIDAALGVGTLSSYTMLEVDLTTAEETARRIARGYPSLDVHAVVGDFESHLDVSLASGMVFELMKSSHLYRRPRANLDVVDLADTYAAFAIRGLGDCMWQPPQGS